MKKLLFLFVTATLAFAAPSFAQGKGNGKWKKQKSENHQGDQDDRYRRNGNWDNRRDDDRRYETRDRRYDNGNQKYSKNAPRKVRDAFYRDYPNARNVRWTKDRGVWTAYFDGGGWFGGSNSVSYAANGQRVSGNTGVYSRRTDRNRNTTTTSRTQKRSPIDVIIGRN